VNIAYEGLERCDHSDHHLITALAFEGTDETVLGFALHQRQCCSLVPATDN
jgi:hypothetical protein